ncbi:glycosyl transferase [Desulfolithobacter dissulfuricans]|uniref:Glycosyl transferase n=2 Tax=Desulfolithobacter dissulfuricans TaxID=2795293 RepID=A0A915U2U2_9BACT|nr:glycosyl transferase [Desulfolithobacter dissulfuricans]
MVTLANGFAGRGIGVDLVLARAEGPYLDEISPDVRVIDLKASRVVTSLPALVRYLRREQPGAMLATMAHANIIAIWARKFARIAPGLLAVREANTMGISAENTRQLRGRLLPLATRFFYPRADAVIANSRGSAEDLSRHAGIAPAKLHVVFNPLDLQTISARAKEKNDHPWFREPGPPVILGTGRLTEQKDFQTLVRAFALARARLEARLVILGEGEDRQKLEKLITSMNLENDISLPGFVSNPYPFMKHASLFVLSSRWEGLPNALLEAIALGTPVVATSCPSGPAEILENGRYGHLVPVGDPEALARAMVETIENPPDPSLLRKRAEDFSSARIIDQYLEILLGESCRPHGQQTGCLK